MNSSTIARSSFTEKDLERWLDQNRISEIECLVPDLTGVARGKILPREKFTEDRGMRMPEDILAMTINGDRPGSDPGYRAVIAAIDHDLVLRPDPTTVCVVPWASDPTAQVIHDCLSQRRQPRRVHAALGAAARHPSCTRTRAGRRSSPPSWSSTWSPRTPTRTCR